MFYENSTCLGSSTCWHHILQTETQAEVKSLAPDHSRSPVMVRDSMAFLLFQSVPMINLRGKDLTEKASKYS